VKGRDTDMENRDVFSSYHPLVNFLYFGMVLLFTMTFMHPICLIISLVCAITYSSYLSGGKAVRRSILYMLPVFLIFALLNPVFSHEGATILTYFPSGNPLTLESIVFGLAAATMLVCVITWFSCYNDVMTSDKFIYLFGRIIPSMSLVLSMTLRFVPKFKAQIKIVSNAQKCAGRDISNGRFLDKVKNGVTILSIMVTWALENAIETADSMKSRGYGLRGRTAFSVYRFDRRDKIALFYLLALGAYIVIGACFGGLKWKFYPTFDGAAFGFFPASLYLSYLILCLTPLILNVMEDRKWNALRSAA
jgi:energy-coupling factor transport system permease protein